MMQNNQFDLLKYLAEKSRETLNNGGVNRVPSLTDLSKEQGVSISYLREQLGVARTLGFVEVRPKTGINLLPYKFSPAVKASLDYAIRLSRANFYKFADLRSKLEADYWYSAIELLKPTDLQKMNLIVNKAIKKITQDRSRVPHNEHRNLHMMIFSRLENPFVIGILESFWEAYEGFSQSVVTDLDYLIQIWEYHKQIVDAICAGDFEKSYHVMQFHMDFLGRKDISS